MTQHTEPTPDAASDAFVPPAFPLEALDWARKIATAAGWPAGCTEPICASHGRCASKLRSVAGEPPTFPTCLTLIGRWMSDSHRLTLAEAEAVLHFLEPGCGWTMEPTPPDEELRSPVAPKPLPTKPHEWLIASMRNHLNDANPGEPFDEPEGFWDMEGFPRPKGADAARILAAARREAGPPPR